MQKRLPAWISDHFIGCRSANWSPTFFNRNFKFLINFSVTANLALSTYIYSHVSGLLKHFKIDSAEILGYSMGGGVALQVAVRHPEQVRRLEVLSGTYTHDE